MLHERDVHAAAQRFKHLLPQRPASAGIDVLGASPRSSPPGTISTTSSCRRCLGGRDRRRERTWIWPGLIMASFHTLIRALSQPTATSATFCSTPAASCVRKRPTISSRPSCLPCRPGSQRLGMPARPPPAYVFDRRNIKRDSRAGHPAGHLSDQIRRWAVDRPGRGDVVLMLTDGVFEIQSPTEGCSALSGRSAASAGRGRSRPPRSS